ncbi:hypothetical protein ACLB1N_08955 [Escherichia coli]
MAHSGTCESPPGKPATTANHCRLPATVRSFSLGQADHSALDQRHNLTLHLCPQPVLGDIRKYSSGSPEIFTQENIFPPPVFSPRSRTTPLAHIAGRAPEIADSVSVMGFTAKVC